jgi:hypothetical protein
MNAIRFRLLRLLRLLVVLLILYAIFRIVFLIVNQSGPVSNPGAVIYWAIRLDIAAIFLTNLPFLLYYLLIDPYVPARRSTLFIVLFLSLLNLPFIALNILDAVYFPYHQRRVNSDLYIIAADSLAAKDFFLTYFWPFILLFLLLATLFVVVIVKIFRHASVPPRIPLRLSIITTAIAGGIALIAIRGVDERPIMPFTPLLHIEARHQPLVSNATLSFAYSAIGSRDRLVPKNYMPNEMVDSMVPVIKQYPRLDTVRRNIVLFILESVNAFDLQIGHPGKAFTPFMDSLMMKSTVFTNAFANGHQSNQGIVALLAGIPTFTDVPYFHSPYAGNHLAAAPELLREEGYKTHFFYGAGPDHFGFEKFGRIAGVSQFYNRETYGRKEHYDGNWGVYDHHFFDYAATTLAQETSPFFATIYNVSTHPPFAIPDEHRRDARFSRGSASQRSISYLDYSLEIFFKKIRSTPWFNETVFFFVADHALWGNDPARPKELDAFRIPMFVYDPTAGGRIENNTVQQIDVMPSLLQAAGYNSPFFALGNSVLSGAGGVAFNRMGEIVQVTNDDFLLGYNEALDTVVYLYNHAIDPSCRHNLSSDPLSTAHKQRLLTSVQAFLQQYQNRLIANRLVVGAESPRPPEKK